MSRTNSSTTEGPSRNAVFEALAQGRRQAILQTLDRISYAKIQELATHVVAQEQDTTIMDVQREEAREAQLSLTHVHLPKLEDADLVTYEDGVVTSTDHPALKDPKFTEIIETDAPHWDAVLDNLSNKRRRIILSTLYREEGPIARSELAIEVARSERDNGEEQPPVTDLIEELHHLHLPKLEDARLITYDVEDELVTYEGHPALDEEWLVAGADDTPRAILSMAEQSADIWTLEGRDNVTERGRALCESADEELFMMFTLEGTVETACVRRIQDALDRGVDVYLGTQNKELRDLVREHAPAVTIWEPQLDWLNLPPTQEKVGRLILADREEILIGTIGDEGPDGIPRETAITGTGDENPLVMLLREMLGSRLDHLDEQSADFRSQIPL